jgi:hypothetical protein
MLQRERTGTVLVNWVVTHREKLIIMALPWGSGGAKARFGLTAAYLSVYYTPS